MAARAIQRANDHHRAAGAAASTSCCGLGLRPAGAQRAPLPGSADELNRRQIEFISFREQLDTGGPLGRAVVVIISAIAELELQAGSEAAENTRPETAA